MVMRRAAPAACSLVVSYDPGDARIPHPVARLHKRMTGPNEEVSPGAVARRFPARLLRIPMGRDVEFGGPSGRILPPSSEGVLHPVAADPRQCKKQVVRVLARQFVEDPCADVGGAALVDHGRVEDAKADQGWMELVQGAGPEACQVAEDFLRVARLVGVEGHEALWASSRASSGSSVR